MSSTEILSVLDACASQASFPMLDNGYIYPAASRLSLFRSDQNWAMVIETFGFSPRAELPDIAVDTFAGVLHDRDGPEKYIRQDAYERYLSMNPHNETRFFYPLEQGDWQDKDDPELVVTSARGVQLRDLLIPIPSLKDCAEYGILNETPDQLRVFELCRYLAETSRERVLATIRERRVSVTPEQKRILQLEAWNHPDLANGQLPGETEAFQQLAKVIETGDRANYRPTQQPNTHWKNWPKGGRL